MIMKKVLFFAIMMMAVATAKAQFAPGTFSIQPKIGFTVSWLSNAPKLPYAYEGKYSLDKTAAGGIIIGADAEYMVNDIFAVEAGINYSMQGSQWEDETWHEGDWRYDINDTKIEVSPEELQPKEEETVIEEKRSKGARMVLLTAGIVIAAAGTAFFVLAVLKLYYLFF